MGVQAIPEGQDLLAAAGALSGNVILTILQAAAIPTVLSLLTSVSNPEFVAGAESQTERAAAQLAATAEDLSRQSTVQGIAQLTATALAERAAGLDATPALDAIASEAPARAETDAEPEPGTVPAREA